MSIYVGNLSYEVEENDLKWVFSGHGTVRKVQVPTNQQTVKNRGFAVVEMETSAEEISAIQMLRGTDWMDRILKVNRARIELEEI